MGLGLLWLHSDRLGAWLGWLANRTLTHERQAESIISMTFWKGGEAHEVGLEAKTRR